MPDEAEWVEKGKIKMKDAFTIQPTSEGAKKASLSVSSRVRFDNAYPVRYTLKVFIIGRVIKEDRPRLQERWRDANSS